jgi:NAD(P)H-hydrate epimerase
MLPVLTPEEMGAADARTIAAGTPVETLMERAGHAVAWAVRTRLRGLYGRRAVVVCGKGNNGGDGVIAARVLRQWGARVDEFHLARGVPRAEFSRALQRADVLVDAMYGTGFRGALEGDAELVANASRSFPGTVIAVDIPSGVNGLTGEVARELAVRADETVCFAAYKPGLLFEPGRSFAGRVRVADIGIAVDDLARAWVTDEADLASWLAARAPDAHKWRSGCFVVGGSSGMTGAPSLVSHAAMRAGAGIVWCGVPGADAAARMSGSEVIAKALPSTPDGALADAAAKDVLDSLERFRALAIGPGLGRSPITGAAVRRIVAAARVPVVIDADAIHAVGDDPALLRIRAAPTILTPHAGEYASLRGAPPGPDRLAAARSLAADTGAIVLLKGPGTVVAQPDGEAWICPIGGPWLATAGTGDVLTGLIAGLLAQGMAPVHAAAAGAFVHGRAADVAGHTGLMAGDLVSAIPRVLADLMGGAGSGEASMDRR